MTLGNAAIANAVADTVMSRLVQFLAPRDDRRRYPVGWCPLTAREIQVMQMVAAGKTNKEIGQALGTSKETVKNQVVQVLSKMGARDRTHAACLLLSMGVIDAPEVTG